MTPHAPNPMQTPDSTVTHSIKATVSHLCSRVDRQPEARRQEMCVRVCGCVRCLSGSSDIIARRRRGPPRLMDGTLLSPGDLATSPPEMTITPLLHKIRAEQRNGWRDGGREGRKGKHGQRRSSRVAASGYASL